MKALGLVIALVAVSPTQDVEWVRAWERAQAGNLRGSRRRSVSLALGVMIGAQE